jgi:hypothetical protein
MNLGEMWKDVRRFLFLWRLAKVFLVDVVVECFLLCLYLPFTVIGF